MHITITMTISKLFPNLSSLSVSMFHLHTDAETSIKLVHTNVVDVSAGNGHAILCDSQGRVFTWGDPYRYMSEIDT